MRNHDFLMSLPRLALLLWIAMRVVDKIDWLYYTCAAAFLLSFLVFLVSSVSICKKDRKEFIVALMGTTRDNLYDLYIAITGIIVFCSMGFSGEIFIFLLILITSIGELVSPIRKKIRESTALAKSPGG